MDNKNNNVLLVAFHNIKALGVRYLETALKKAGYSVSVVFFKGFNSRNPKPADEKELELLCKFISERNPVMIGLSVMSSMYGDTVFTVMDTLKKEFGSTPLVCGGAYATMFPEKMLDAGADFVIRSDGERPITMLADSLTEKTDTKPNDIPSLCFRDNEGNLIINDIGGLAENLDEYGIPAVECEDACFIENDTCTPGDPQLDTMSYEVICSRGCPFTCSYCCCVNLHRLNPKGTKAVRFRSVESVMEELKIAKKKLKKLVFVHFYDEIFPNTPGWVDSFVETYKKQIGLPFTIWSHPKMVDAEVLKKLVKAGLSEVIMGIQSGSDKIRKQVFHRYETREDILNAVQTIHDSGVFWASYDFMLQHPFETIEDLKETYRLVKEMPLPFELQLHGLNFLPGTDIVQMAIDEGYLSSEEMDKIMFASMEEQFGAYWKRENEEESRLWYQMTFCLQFSSLRSRIVSFEDDPFAHKDAIASCYAKAQKLAKLSYLRKKATVFFKSKL